MTRAVRFIALTLLLPASARAQSADATTSTLILKPGERVIVTIGSHETIRGRVVRVADEGLFLEEGSARYAVPLADLERVERPKDRIWNGALIGYGVGFATGVVMVLSDPCKPQPGAFIDLCFDSPEFAMALGGLITGPIGFAVGAIGDAIVRRPRVVFDRGSRNHVAIAVAPAFTRGGGGLRVAVTF